MRTFARLIRRYVLAATLTMILLVGLAVGSLVALTYRYTDPYNAMPYTSKEISSALHKTTDGLAFDASRTPAEWMAGYAWAMVLDDEGDVIWEYDLPAELPRHYTARDEAVFIRWYLDDYPVYSWVEDYGLFVVAMEKGSMVRYNVYTYPDVVRTILYGIPPAVFLVVALVFACCIYFSWRSSRSLRAMAVGLDALAEGQTVRLPTSGFTGELAEKLNQTSAQLQKRNEIIAQRDNARTNWIAGVSHDIRTPLALILGWAEQMEHDPVLAENARQKAAGIRTQSEKIRSLIEDLNLTSKLQYGAQPLRRQPETVGPLLRELIAQFCDSLLADRCEVTLEQSEGAERTRISVDKALLGRAVENLLSNSVRHNLTPVRVSIRAVCVGDNLLLTFADDGRGYPPAVLAVLTCPEKTWENAPHILGLHVVEQILTAHGGSARFAQNSPHGAKAVLCLPKAGPEN